MEIGVHNTKEVDTKEIGRKNMYNKLQSLTGNYEEMENELIDNPQWSNYSTEQTYHMEAR